MLIFPLKKEWYEKLKNGKKTVEYREVKEYWHKRLYKWCKKQWEEINKEFGIKFPMSFFIFCKECEIIGTEFYIGSKSELVYFQLGYNPDTRLKATIFKIGIVDGMNTDLKIDKPVYAIHFNLERENLRNDR